MSEADQLRQMHHAGLPRRRRGGFRRHRTYFRDLKWCCQSVAVRLRRSEHGEKPWIQLATSAASNGYSSTDASAAALSRNVETRTPIGRRRSRRRRTERRHARVSFVATWQLFLVPQSTAHTLLATPERSVPRRNPTIADLPAAAALHIRNDRRALRNHRRCRPTRTISSAGRPSRH